MARKTQNAVLNSDGTFFQLTNDANSFVQFLQLFNALRFKQGTDKDGNLLWEDSEGKPTTVNTGEPYIPAKPRSGYGSYGTKVGFADPISPEKLDAQGVGKYLAKLLEVSQMIILAGGDEAKEMQNVLDGAFAYLKIAPELLAQQKSNEAVKQALAALQQVNNGDNAAAQKQLINMLGANGVPTPTATQDIVATEVTPEASQSETEAPFEVEMPESTENKVVTNEAVTV